MDCARVSTKKSIKRRNLKKNLRSAFTAHKRLMACILTLRVLSVSSATAGVTVAITDVLALPPKEFCKMRVNLESRYGTKFLQEKKVINKTTI